MFSVLKSWDNRKRPVRLGPNGKSYTRKIQWLEDQDDLIKIKLEDNEEYKEVLTDEKSAEIMWQRFREGQAINDCISILGTEVPKALQSRKAAEQEKMLQEMADDGPYGRIE